MSVEIRVPTMGESVTEATVGQWLRQVGDRVEADEPIVELETDKVNLEVPAPVSGTIVEIKVAPGDTVEVGALLATVEEGAAGAAKAPVAAPAPKAQAAAPAPKAQSAPKAAPKAATNGATPAVAKKAEAPAPKKAAEAVAPSVRRIAEEGGLDPASIAGTGPGGRVTKADALKALEARAKAPEPAPAKAPREAPGAARQKAGREERVPMTRLRRTIAQRLKEAQATAAMLTTFNEADMSGVMALRSKYKDLFEKRHGVRLGFMGFFVKACVTALKEIPAVNGEIDGTDILYKNYYDIGVAVGTERGLVVPVLRDADEMGLADIEKTINDFGRRARDGELKLEELQGGTFTISNGGVYGSLMSTPILNAPQSGILGMHKIEERPVVMNGQIVVRPMMYLALSYDHRLVDGREAVTFLVRVKENIEDPERLVLGL
ncbi:MAG: 2-oxoglutarate dehydrogenase complex dihydrolipoyllysine-residue succinyltransferase [Alphaproteobacteria bacterium]|nr:2-oxoglutarate dehydrogenase complex dihydrolipoyllysine-residue succinyltransferase [Alphaproteobacteria bacterium]